MPNPSSKPKRPRDASELAAKIVAETVDDVPPAEPEPDWSELTDDERRSLAAKMLADRPWTTADVVRMADDYERGQRAPVEPVPWAAQNSKESN